MPFLKVYCPYYTFLFIYLFMLHSSVGPAFQGNFATRPSLFFLFINVISILNRVILIFTIHKNDNVTFQLNKIKNIVDSGTEGTGTEGTLVQNMPG